MIYFLCLVITVYMFYQWGKYVDSCDVVYCLGKPIGMVFGGMGQLMSLVVSVVTLGQPIRRTADKLVEIATEQSEIEDQLGL